VLKRRAPRRFFRCGAMANGAYAFLKQILRPSLSLIDARSIQCAASVDMSNG